MQSYLLPVRFGSPNFFVEADPPAMQRIGRVVDRQLVFLAVQLEPALRNAIGVAPHGSAKVGIGFALISLKTVKSQYDVRHMAATVRNLNGNNRCSEIDNAYFHAVLVLQCV